MTQPSRVLAVIVCGAGPASDVGKLIKLAHQRGWTVQLIATPAALPFLNTADLETLTGSPVRSQYRSPGEPRSPKADAVIVAPATYNTICKCAQGISDTYALGILAEAISLPMPVVILPFVNTALASRQPFHRAIAQLADEGVKVLLGPDLFEPHRPGTGGEHTDAFPWHAALIAVEPSGSN
ncbi:MAG TPA: flavoprotein [Streptosporangiaceae bacterium]|nr:flavoprotein [Streptosporangiaceae bacterium]